MENKDKLETLIKLVVEALVMRNKLVWIVVRTGFAIVIILSLLVGFGVGRIVQLLLA